MAGETPEVDNVNRPKHYTDHPSGLECIDIAEDLSFTHGSAFKYVWRWHEKGGVESLEKALWYLKRGDYQSSPFRKGLKGPAMNLLIDNLWHLTRDEGTSEELKLIARYYATGLDRHLIDLTILLSRLIEEGKK